LWPIGEYAERFGLEKPARALVDRILRVRGRVPLSRGIEGGAPDLAVAAVSARADLDRHPVHIEIPGPMPRPHRAVYDAFAGLLSTPRERVKVGAARARMRQLAPELASLRYAPARCYVVAEQAAWVPEADAPALFDGMTAPIFDKSGRVRFGAEMLCRARTALSMDAVDAALRVGLALRLLGAGPGQILPFDVSAVEHHPALVHFVGKDQVAGVAAAAIADHVDWVDSSPGLRAWLGHALADSVAPREDSVSGMPEAGLQAAYERLVTFDLAHRRGDEARAVLRAWIGAVRAAANRTHSSIYPMELMMRRLYALGELAASVGVETEVRTLLDELRRGRYGKALARPLAVAAYLLAEGTRQGVRGSSRGSRQSRCRASQDNPGPAFAPTRSSW